MYPNNNTTNPTRRTFLKQTGLITASLLAARFPVWGKSIFADSYPIHNIPVDKHIDPTWLHSLYQRGAPSIYCKSKNELKYIGMPVGGLHSGTVYLGGDGRLWLWQVYNETMEPSHEGIDPKTVNWNDGTTVRKVRSRDGACYVEPTIAHNKRVLEQGFAVRIADGSNTIIKELNEESWEEVVFEASYPVGLVRYQSPSVPVAVTLKVYSPFIPLNAEDSSLPATVLRIEVENKSTTPLKVDLIGWLENGVNKLSAKRGSGLRRSVSASTEKYTAVFHDFVTDDDELQQATDAGSMLLMLHNVQGVVDTDCLPWPMTEHVFDKQHQSATEKDGAAKLVGSISVSGELASGSTLQADYSVCWHFNNPHSKLKQLVPDAQQGYAYGQRFADARQVGEYLATHFQQLTSLTELWRNTWYDATLPYWFLDRTFVNIGTLATANTYRFASGRFWGWEGVGACAGTCTHVWQYAQAVARIFPELERDLRQRVDLGVALQDDGAIIFRAENERRPAIDGQAGTILRFYREHQMSVDDTFLKTNWPAIRKTVEFMLAQDKNGDGMTDTPMENTLDAIWEGEIAWIVGLCIAAARAAQAMAEEVGDEQFAKHCAAYVDKGQKNMETLLFNGEYFIHRPDAEQGRKKLGSYNTCHIDQVYGQSWAFQVGLPRVLDKEKSKLALQALWKYNFTMDVGPYIKTHVGGRPYALPGEGGMVMNTNPKNEPKPYGENVTWQLGYFHECMSGFEHQVAAHMIAEGMIDEGLVLTRVIHDRYHAAKRNPFNEIECSDHYARAMASYGTFINACGFEYHGPKRYMAFSPKITPEHFKSAFTAAAGWGTYTQTVNGDGQQHHAITLAYGSLLLDKLAFDKVDGVATKNVTANIQGKTVPLDFVVDGSRVTLSLRNTVTIRSGETLAINLI